MHDNFIVTVLYFFLAMYAIVICLLIRNIANYVIGMQRYKEFRITWFYILAVTIVCLRVADNILILLRNHGVHHKVGVDYHMWIVSYCCRQLENMLGLQ